MADPKEKDVIIQIPHDNTDGKWVMAPEGHVVVGVRCAVRGGGGDASSFLAMDVAFRKLLEGRLEE